MIRYGSTPAIPLMRHAASEPGQIGIVVVSLDDALTTWGASAPARSQWRIWMYGPHMMIRQTYLGEPAHHSMLLAMNGASPQLELVHPLRGPSIYHTWLETHGPGLHHIGYYVDDLVAVDREMLDAGFEIVQTGEGFGADGTGRYSYYDTREALGFYLEGIEVPVVRREPDRTWPE